MSLLLAPGVGVNLDLSPAEDPAAERMVRAYVIHLGQELSCPSLYVDRAELGQTASCTLVISYEGSIDRP